MGDWHTIVKKPMAANVRFTLMALTVVAATVVWASKDGLSLAQVATESSPAIIQLTYWGEFGQSPERFNVDGTGFLVGREGTFVTAAHVLGRYRPSSGQMSVIIHQRDKHGAGFWFDVIETDKDHDLALCQVKNFKPMKDPKAGSSQRPLSTYRPITSLKISAASAVPGDLIATIGFPLGSFASPVVQFGNIGATDAMLEAVPQFPAGRRDLMIVSVSANHGNSGGPVISLRTGEVLGMIIQYVPAPLLQFNGQGIPQQSGLMVAVPAKWIAELLDRHHVSNKPIGLKERIVL
jgi:S1-C subfamily serine protease